MNMTYDEAKVFEGISDTGVSGLSDVVTKSGLSVFRALTALESCRLNRYIVKQKTDSEAVFSRTDKGKETYARWKEIPF